MPRLPQYLSQQPLPSSTGVRGGIVGVPVVGGATVGTPGPSAIEQSLGVFPQTMANVAGMMQQTAQLEQRRQQAQDVLDATLADQDFAQRYDARVAELEQGDYRVLPKSVLDDGNTLLGQIANERGLSPQAKAILTARAQERMTVAQQRALSFRAKRQDQDKTYALSNAVHEAQQRVANARDPYERQVAWGQFEETLTAFQASYLADPGALAELRVKTAKAIEVQTVQTAIQADPEAMYTQLLAQTRGEPTREELPLAPMESLAQLTAQARDVRRQQWGEREHQERWQDYQVKKRQEENSVELRTSIYTTPVNPSNVATFDKLIRQAAEMMKRGELDESTGEHLMQTAQAHSIQAAKPPVRIDDPAAKDTLTLMVMQAQTPDEFTRAREMLTQAGVKKLTPETYMQFVDKLDSREKGRFWHDLPEVRAAREILVRGAIIPYGGSFAGQMKPKMQQKLSLALDTWEYALQQRLDDPRQGLDAVRRDARRLAEDMRQRYLVPDFEDKADVQEYLPPEAQQAKNPHELAQVLHKWYQEGIPPWQINIMRENWHRWKGVLGWEPRSSAPSSSAPTLPPSSPPGPAQPAAPQTPYRTN
jgi:hypothetical protein